MDHQDKPLAIIIAGPTGIGKTAFALLLAQHLQTEIISADSRQCYREMSIGTAKPSNKELALVKHHFINSHSIQKPISAFDFEQGALEILKNIFKEKKTAIICGGTGLYIKALCEGLDAMPPINQQIATSLNEEFNQKGKIWLQETIAKEDPLFYAASEKENPARLLRALSFIRSSGKSIVDYQTNTIKKRPFRILKIALSLPRTDIYNQINQRVDQMMLKGLLAEAQSLYTNRHLVALNTVGYSELFDYISGQQDLPTAIALIKQHSRQYAKRQLTWFKSDKSYQWFAPYDTTNIINFLETHSK